jgi:transglutaminase-like putative cysteine protease
LEILANYISKHLNHVDGGPSTAEGVERTGYGDCWGLSDWSAKILSENGYPVRIVQGPNSYSSNHRWLNVEVDGKWITFEPSLVTAHYGHKRYTRTCASLELIVESFNC